MSRATPDVSIITPNFNGERYLTEFLDSVVHQDGQQTMQIIIIS
ncbi:MAG: hypothetical protein QOG79_8020 [Mycobacterium sp.]|jgi:glycosyltransferase involved in cell wall biosynthesis|nr:hypothetical protein [Mycobacterium sp.]MDT5230296.1 hypothetical protein [Mycobacterium sp.]MDT5304293.1 hypothetical protein [Mycobacterium sp.]MDT5318590.1 hypothetical protein [Mycobacterium sp.]